MIYAPVWVLTTRYIGYLSIFLTSNYISSDSNLSGHPLVARGRKGPEGVHCPLTRFTVLVSELASRKMKAIEIFCK